MSDQRQDQPLNYSAAMQASAQASYEVGSAYSWDAFVRQSYDQANSAIQAQARLLRQRGNVSATEARMLVEGQRNALVMLMRNRLTLGDSSTPSC